MKRLVKKKHNLNIIKTMEDNRPKIEELKQLLQESIDVENYENSAIYRDKLEILCKEQEKYYSFK